MAPIPTRRVSLGPLAAGAALVLVLLASSSAPVSGQAEFCAQLSNFTAQCANPSTEDAVNLALFTGKWYIAGATAGWAFLPYTILGGQCATVEYTSIGRQLLRQAISVVNQNVRLLDDNARGQVGAISSATQALGLGVEQLCGAIAGLGTNSISSLIQQALKVQGSTKPAQLVQGAKAVQTGLAAASGRASSINDILKAIQELNNFLNGVGLPDPIDIPGIQAQLSGLLAQIDAFLALIGQEQLSIVGGASAVKKFGTSPATKAAANSILSITGKAGQWAKAVSGMTAARNALKKVIASLGSKTGAISDIILKNNTAVPSDSVAKMNKAFASKKGVAKGSSPKKGVKKFAPLSNLKNIGGKLFSILSGKALQDRKNKGKFSIDLGALKGAPLGIVDLTGKASAGYATALIYLCAKDPSTGNRPMNNLMVLTRAPSDATAGVIKDALAVAQGLGIFLPGTNPLLKIAQNPTLCSIIDPLK